METSLSTSVVTQCSLSNLADLRRFVAGLTLTFQASISIFCVADKHSNIPGIPEAQTVHPIPDRERGVY